MTKTYSVADGWHIKIIQTMEYDDHTHKIVINTARMISLNLPWDPKYNY
jgi:hypothetical protein